MTVHRHHRRMRSQGGSDDSSNIMLVTPQQHVWIHLNPAKAYEMGWLVKSWQDPAQVPILTDPGLFEVLGKEYA